MESLTPAAGPPVFLVTPGELSGPVLTLTGPEGHHAAAVRRLRAGERADVSDGAGTLAEGVVTAVGKDSVSIEIRVTRAFRRRSRGWSSRRRCPRATGASSRSS